MLISTDGNRFAFEKAEVLLLTSMMASVGDHPNLAALWMHPAKAEAWATDGHRAVLAELSSKPTKAAAKARAVAITAATAALAAESAGMVWINLGGSLDPVLLIASGRFSTAWRVVVMPISSKGVPPVYSGQPDKAPKQPAKGGGQSATKAGAKAKSAKAA